MKNKFQTFYEIVSQDQQYKYSLADSTVSKETIENYEKIQNLLKFPLRPYQLEALTAFQFFLRDGFDSRSLKEKTLQKSLDNGGQVVDWHKVGFEMATGSGKTLLMGSIILDLYYRGYKDFLILTPNTILFDKTIANFTPHAIKSVFGDGWNLSYNLVTGDSYRDKTCNYETQRDISFYIFNMQKFYDKGTLSSKKRGGKDTMKGVPYVRRPLEESLWKDSNQTHTVSFMEFLRERRPIIISDEAHHYQQKITTEAILELLPSMVLEFTATSIEKGKSEEYGQNNLYKYPMQRYIGEGYGKRIFAVGCGTSGENASNEVTDDDKQKLIWGMLIHLVKNKSLLNNNVPITKAMMLIKARTIKHANAINLYLKNWPNSLLEEVDNVLEQVNRESTDIAKVVRENIPQDKTILIKELKRVANSVFTIHSENKTDTEVWADYQSLYDNTSEVVNQVRIFTEGIDYDNFYTVVILGDTKEGNKVSKNSFVAAQLIGRGLRLYKEYREFDSSEHDLKEQSEILHVICDRGKNFEKFVREVQEQLDLKRELIEIPTEEETKENKVNRAIADNYEVPILTIKPVATGKSFQSALQDDSLNINKFMDQICAISRGERVLKPEVLSMVDYAEITSENIAIQKDKPATTRITITLTKDDIARWALDFVEQTGTFIGNNSFNDIKKLIELIIKAGIKIDTAYPIDYKRALKALKKNIIEFYGQQVFKLMFKNQFTFQKKNSGEIFVDGTVTVRKRDGSTLNLISAHQSMSTHFQQKGIIVEGYKFSIRPFVKFDSPPEKWVADVLEHLCSLDEERKSFWVRNDPFEYPVDIKPAAFYPDFLAFIKNKWIIVDVKGKHLAEARQIENRKRALKLLEEKSKVQTFFLIDKIMEEKGFRTVEIDNIEDLRGFDELQNLN